MTYELNKQIDKAWFEIDKLETPTLPQINLTSRKHAPQTIKDIKDLLAEEENTWVLALEAKPGLLVEDVVAATMAHYITDQIIFRLQQKARDALDKQKTGAIQAEFERMKKAGKDKK